MWYSIRNVCVLILLLSTSLAFSQTKTIEEEDPDADFGLKHKNERLIGYKLSPVAPGYITDAEGHVIGVDYIFGSTDSDMLSANHLRLLQGFPKLTIIQLPCDIVTDDMLLPLSEIKNLETSELHTSQITDKGLKALAGLNKLRKVSLLGATKLTDAAMETVADWEKLEELDISNTQITDDGIHTIRGLTKLRVLSLGAELGCRPESPPDTPGISRITNRSVEVLSGFKELRRLYMFDTCIDEEGVRLLHEALPHWEEE
jgi:hypothetical protein